MVCNLTKCKKKKICAEVAWITHVISRVYANVCMFKEYVGCRGVMGGGLLCKYHLGPSPLTETHTYSSLGCAAFCVPGKRGGDTGVVDWMGHFVPSFSQNEKKKKNSPLPHTAPRSPPPFHPHPVQYHCIVCSQARCLLLAFCPAVLSAPQRSSFKYVDNSGSLAHTHTQTHTLASLCTLG